MPYLVALGLMVYDKKIFTDLRKKKKKKKVLFLSEGIKFLQEIVKRTMAGTFL